MSNDFGELLQAAIEDRLAGMSPEDFGALVARVRPPSEIPVTDPASARRAIGAKAAGLLNLETDRNGAVGGWAAAVAARAPQPQPQPEQPPAPSGFGTNRAQTASGDANPPAPVQQQQWGNQPRIYPGGTL
jgi:hypothetical protein